MGAVRLNVPEGSTVEVLRNLRDGDVVWVTIPEDLAEEYVDALHEAVDAALDVEATIFVAPRDVATSVSVLPLSDLLALREVIEAAIRGLSLAHACDEA